MISRKFASIAIVLCIVCISFNACSGTEKYDTPTPDTARSEPWVTTVATEPHKTVEVIQVPDLSGTDANDARTLLVNSGLVPVLEEEYSEYAVKGIVTRTEPIAFTQVQPGSKVTVFVSRGLSKYYATNCNVSTSVLNKEFKYDDVYVHVDSIYVENDVLNVLYQIGFKEYQNDYNGAQYLVPGTLTYYFRYSDFSVNIEGNLFNPTVYGEAITAFVPRNAYNNQTKFDSIQLQIPLNEAVSRKPTQIDVTYTANVCLDWQVVSYSSYQNTFHIQNITW